ncbi:TonB-dependent receptor [Ramlibacter sp.]|uniref:TonB-dependent receptor n=1 Tax=Ramlibacter sp. TaxID=1917967 RepID=UPI002BAE7347|nr:TonB-dependent receptor [Ramlibacter sp.]HWI81637.1 TonB-dependent receptor [Ramlibacter sp.]
MSRLLAAVMAGAAGAALGQVLPQVTVTATRTEASPFDVPASVDVIDGERLRAAGRPEINLSESVGLVPGVIARDRQNYAQDLQLSIRGFGARSSFGVRGVRLYVDGIPATMPDGQGQLSHIDLASAERIELLRGPFSVLYGNSSGGVLQVFTEAGAGPGTVTPSLAVGSDGLVRPGIRASGAAQGLRYAVSANRFSSDGWREHSAARRNLGNARLDVTPREGSDWTVVANALDLRADDPLGLTRARFESAPRSVDASAVAFDTRKTVRQDQLGVVHQQQLAGGNRLRLMVYAGQRATTQFQAIPAGPQANALHPGGVIGLERRYAGTDLRWTARSTVARAPFELVAGVSYDTLTEQRRGWQNFVGSTLGVAGALRRDEENRVWNLDPYLQGVWQFQPRWTLTAGVRHGSVRFSSADRYRAGPNGDDSGGVRYRATLPVAGLMFAWSPQVHLHAAWGRGFETPTFNELAYRPDGTAGLNFGLRPSRSRNLELGVKGRSPLAGPWRSQWSAALFQVATQDEIVTRTSSGGRSSFQNAGATRRRGLELAWSAATDAGWQVQLAQTWLDARYREAFTSCSGAPCAPLAVPAGNRIPGTARAVTAAELGWQPARGWRAGLELRRSGAVYVNDANSEAAPAFTMVAVHTGYVFERRGWTLSAAGRIDNLLDRRAAGSVIVNEGNGRFFEPAPGRGWVLKLAGSYAF